jgi:hypothetical protein
MNIERGKEALNAQAKAGLRADLRAKTWVQKVAAIARMNKASALARDSMRQAQALRHPVTPADPKRWSRRTIFTDDACRYLRSRRAGRSHRLAFLP